MRRILLIDDTPEIAELLSFALRDRGYEVFASGFTGSVNELVVEQHADALVLDCSVYNMSESLFDTVRNDPNFADAAARMVRFGPPIAPNPAWIRTYQEGLKKFEQHLKPTS